MAEQILKTEFSEVMQKSYIDYAMSVICQRALPDVRDGLKPVQRRVLYAMDQLGLNYDKPHRKSARIVGDTMGKYHPHGDSSIYDALVVLEQDFKKGMALVDGHGNFGSIEGDGAAAMRYTEAKLKKFTQEVYLADLDKDVVDFGPNFDETEKEPIVLPVKVPNILINGAEGIAVGMTTSVPTHNLGEVLDAVIAYMNNNDITTEQLMEYVEGPDFPTGGLVVNKSDLLNIYELGTGKIKLRGKVDFEPGKTKADKDKLVITEIPYTMIGANIGKFISDICELIENRKLVDVVDISNESSKEGIRIALELKKNADIEKIKNTLYAKTRLEDTFGVNMLAIVDGRPEILGLKSIIEENVKFQYEITNRKYSYLLNKEIEQKEIKEGLIKACNIIDLIIEILRGSNSLKDAKDCLVNGNTDNIKFKNKESKIYAGELHFTPKQAQAILDLRLYKLIGLEILALEKDYADIVNRIAEYEDILGNRKSMTKVIEKELKKIKKDYEVERKTVIIDAKQAVYVEEKIKEVEVVFTMDRFGYVKTIDRAVYEKNKETVDSEHKYVFTCMNTDKVCVFTDQGNLHQLKVLDTPFAKIKDKGTPVDNISNYDSKVENIVFIDSLGNIRDKKLLFTTLNGMMKLVDASEFEVSKRTVAATKLSSGDKVISINYTEATTNVSEVFVDDMEAPLGDVFAIDEMEGYQETFDFGDDFGGEIVSNIEEVSEKPILLAQDEVFTNEIVVLQTSKGLFLRFPLKDIPEKKKGAVGVRGLKLSKDECITNVYVCDAGDSIIVDIGGEKYDLRKLTTKKRDQAPQKPKK